MFSHTPSPSTTRALQALGDQLVVGLIPDSEIRRCKGPPILNEAERLKLVESVKWVDEVITGVPYDLTPEFLEELLVKHKIDYVIHGDDPCVMPDGSDDYAHVKRMGRFRMVSSSDSMGSGRGGRGDRGVGCVYGRILLCALCTLLPSPLLAQSSPPHPTPTHPLCQIKRTEGVSTTDIVGRMLMCSRVSMPGSHEQQELLTREFSRGREDPVVADGDGEPELAASPKERNVTVSRFMPTSRRIVQFSSGRVPKPGARIVYIDGSFDLFHVGHIDILKVERLRFQ